MARLFAFVAMLVLAPAAALAVEGEPPDAEPAAEAVQAETVTPIMETVVVGGEQPGPGLWRVTGANGHELWILGTLSPLPKRMRWQSDKVERLVARSQRVLAVPQAELEADTGFFGRLALIPAAIKATKNPDDATLAEVLPAELYGRWRIQKQRYLGKGDAIERRRPLLAAFEVFDEALDDNGLTGKDLVWPVVRKAARRARVETVTPRVEVVIDKPRQALKDFARTSLDDVACLEAILDRLESDLEGMKLRANAWALGDLEELARLPYVDHRQACNDVLLHSVFAAERGLGDLPERIRAAWLEAAEETLAVNDSSFAVLPIHTLLRLDGLLAALGERGYTIVPPTRP